MTDPRRAQRDAISWEVRLDRTEAGRMKPTLNNAYLVMSHDSSMRQAVRLNEFSLNLERKGVPWRRDAGLWSDDDDNRLRCYLAERHRVDFAQDTVQKAVSLVAHDNAYHPVREYLEGLPEPEGPPEDYLVQRWLRTWLGAAESGADDLVRYVDRVGVLWMVGAVARIFKPGCKLDTVLILEGDQGLGKSTALRILGGDWFSDTSFVIGDKDAYQVLRGVWIYEMAELDALNKTEATKYKAFITSPEDRYRPSYGHHVVNVPRQCVFAGSTNQHEYLRDPTGNRRFWPVFCTGLNPDEFSQYRDQLWAEALALFRAGEAWWPSGEDVALFSAQQSYREIADPWESIIGSWLTLRTQTEFTTAELLEDALNIDAGRIDERAMAMRVSKVMRKLGFRKRQASTREERARARYVWVAPPEADR